MLKIKNENFVKNLSKVGFGTGRNFGDLSQASKKSRMHLIHQVIETGVNWIDTASAYCDGNAERLIGEAFAEKKNNVSIFTKFSAKDASPQQLRTSIDKSLKRLKREHIEIYQFHWPNTQVPLERTCECLLSIIEQGKISAVGISNFSETQTRLVNEFLGEHLISSQTELNLFNWRAQLEEQQNPSRKNFITLGYSPFLGLRFLNDDDIRVCQLKALAEKHQCSMHSIVMKFLLRETNQFSITGSQNIDHIKSNLESCCVPLSSDEITSIEELFPGSMIEIEIDKIKLNSTREYPVYETLHDATVNNLDHYPGPATLASDLKNGTAFKPVLLRRRGSEFILIGGMVRFWAWKIANSARITIPSIVYG